MQWKRFVRALKDGCTLTVGAGPHRLRVVRIEDAEGALVGYGEHAQLASALAQAAETYRSGLGTFAETFSGGRYLSGARRGANALDGLLLRGGVLTLRAADGAFVARIDGPPECGSSRAERSSLHRAVRVAVRDAARAGSVARQAVI